MNETHWWTAVIERDPAFDNTFVYAVRTTGVYCRPTCPSRRPFRENVTFFSDASQAESAGYRPCQRCHPSQANRLEAHAELITHICRYLEQTEGEIPTLEALSNQFGFSPYHLQRTFKRIVGVSPRKYADAQRQKRLKTQLKESTTVTEALYAAGYGASSRLYAQSHETLGMTPIHYRKGGIMATIVYTITPCEFGAILVAATEKGICKISLGNQPYELEDELRQEFPNATILRDDAQLSDWVNVVLNTMNGDKAVLNLPLDIQATSFQRKVWEALRTIPIGETVSYSTVAELIGEPNAARAVAHACAANPVAIAIPCHRVVNKQHGLSGYRWGIARKKMLLQAEQNVVKA